MDIEFDPDKDAANTAKHRISLGRAVDFEILHYQADDRHDYGETRYRTSPWLQRRRLAGQPLVA